MKIAIYCTGFLRTFKTNAVYLRVLMEKYNCDLYFYVVSNEFECDSYFNTSISFNLIQKELNPKVFILEKEDENQEVQTKIKRMWFKLSTIDFLRKNIEKRESIKYDLVMRLRPDIFINDLNSLCQLIDTYEKGQILLPKDECKSYPKLNLDGFQGFNDQFAFGETALMEVYCSLYSHIEEYYSEGFINSSSLLKKHLENNKVCVKLVSNFFKVIQKENKIITISGDSGSGKTTLAKELSRLFKKQGMKTLVYECDRYHKWERGDENWKIFTHLHPEANNIEEEVKDIALLKTNHSIIQRDYDHINGKFTIAESIVPSSIIIVIGLHALYDSKINSISDLKIFLDPNEKVKNNWKIWRDKEERGYSKKQVESQIEKRYPFYSTFIEPQKENADLIISFKETFQVFLKNEQKEFETLEQVSNFIVCLI
jgi:uridine kinase